MELLTLKTSFPAKTGIIESYQDSLTCQFKGDENFEFGMDIYIHYCKNGEGHKKIEIIEFVIHGKENTYQWVKTNTILKLQGLVGWIADQELPDSEYKNKDYFVKMVVDIINSHLDGNNIKGLF